MGIVTKAASKLAVKNAAKKASKLAVDRVASPAILKSGSGVTRDLAPDVLAEAALRVNATPYSKWRVKNEDKIGDMFDYSRLRDLPDVPQTAMPRYVPPRGPSDRMTDALRNPEVERGVNAAVERGMTMGGPEWYNTDQLRRRALAVVGRTKGPEAHRRLMDIVPATSPGMKIPDNTRTGTYYNYLVANGLPIPEKPAPGYGAKTQGLHRQNVMNLLENGGWNVFQNPKPASFASNLQGNQHNVTVDTHNIRLPGILSRDPRFLATSVSNGKGEPTMRPQLWHNEGALSMDDAVKRPVFWDSVPRDNEYGHYEDWQRVQAKKLGLTPAQYQASMWLGAGEETGLGSSAEPFLKTIEARVKYTADRLGVSPERVMDEMISGKTPLLAKGGRVSYAVKNGRWLPNQRPKSSMPPVFFRQRSPQGTKAPGSI